MSTLHLQVGRTNWSTFCENAQVVTCVVIAVAVYLSRPHNSTLFSKSAMGLSGRLT
jgi:hypothetical protein